MNWLARAVNALALWVGAKAGLPNSCKWDSYSQVVTSIG